MVGAALADGQEWVRRCGRRPLESAAERAWTGRVIAAYRDLRGIGGDDPTGLRPTDDRELIDLHRSERALRQPRALQIAADRSAGVDRDAPGVDAPPRTA